MRILTASDRALLVETADLHEAMRLNLAFEGLPGVIECIPGARTVLVSFDPLRITAAELAEVLASTEVGVGPVPARGEVAIPVRYNGDDLDEVAALLSVSTEELVSRHLAARWQVAFTGFAPGFGYIVGDDPLFEVPRRSSPRTRVPAGSVALAGNFTGVYPRDSPGGWQLIGRTDAEMWNLDRDPPALLVPGTVVRFERMEREVAVAAGGPVAEPVEVSGPATSGAGVSSPSTGSGVDRVVAGPVAGVAGPVAEPVEVSGPAIEVVSTSLQLLVQDAGRPGHAGLGVSASGAADRTALRDANRAVGNSRDAAVLECVGGAVLRSRGPGVAVVTGAIGELSVTGTSGAVRPVSHGTPFATTDGDELTLDHPARGLRYVIGVRGGVVAASALGSAATDTLAGLGPAPLSAGDVLAVGCATCAAVDPVANVRELPASGDLIALEITVGPRDDWFTEDAIDVLTGQEWEVTPHSDRVGIRLRGDVPLQRRIEGELPSEGAVTGAIQVPADGQPVLFLTDHPLTGGYPIIGALTDRCLDLAAQLPPGVRVRFRIQGRPRA